MAAQPPCWIGRSARPAACLASRVPGSRAPPLPQGSTTPHTSRPRRGCVLTRCGSGSASLSDEEMEVWKRYFDSDESVDVDDWDLRGPPARGGGVSPPQEAARLPATCRGCGVALQSEQETALGYVDARLFDTKRRHRQLDRILCGRCQALSQGMMIPAVSSFSEVQDALTTGSRRRGLRPAAPEAEAPAGALVFKGQSLLTPEQLRDQLKDIRARKVVCVMVIDILDASGSFLNTCRDLIGGNPVVIVASKGDLLPKGTDRGQVQQWLQSFVTHKGFKCLSAHLVSNKVGWGVDEVCSSILQARQGRDVYVIGAANVGKSAFIRCMLREMSRVDSDHFDMVAASMHGKLPVESAMPGTTLGLVRLAAFASGGALFDTPGLHLHHRMPHILTPGELKAIHPRRKLRPYVAASPYLVAEQNDCVDPATERVVPCATYHWGALLRIDVLTAPIDVAIVFIGTGAVQVFACSLMDPDELVELDYESNDAGGIEAAEATLFGAQSVATHGGLRVAREVNLEIKQVNAVIGDIAMSGLPGWVSLVSGRARGPIKLRVWTPCGVQAYLRPPLPCPCPIDAGKMVAF